MILPGFPMPLLSKSGPVATIVSEVWDSNRRAGAGHEGRGSISGTILPGFEITQFYWTNVEKSNPEADGDVWVFFNGDITSAMAAGGYTKLIIGSKTLTITGVYETYIWIGPVSVANNPFAPAGTYKVRLA